MQREVAVATVVAARNAWRKLTGGEGGDGRGDTAEKVELHASVNTK